MISTNWSILCIFLLVTGVTFSQPVSNIDQYPPGKIKGFARNAMKMGDYYTALDYYKNYCERKPDDYKALLQLADCYRLSRDYEQAEAHYKLAYQASEKNNKLALYYLALMQQSNGKYESAKANLEEFAKVYKTEKNAKTYKKLTKQQLLGCEAAQAILDSVLTVRIYPLNETINNPHIDFSPTYINDSAILFASLREDKIKYYNTDETEQMPVSRLFRAERFDTTWTLADTLPETINLQGVHTGNGTFSPKSGTFYFTQCRKNFQYKNICAIYSSTIQDGQWTDPVRLNDEINLKKYSSTQPTIGIESSKEYEVLYFVSDRPGGKGGKDLWYSIYDDRKNEFKTPKNIGSKVNTPGDEATPFYDNDTKTMYFSSDGWPGLGGYDIFEMTGEVRKFTEPKNIGHPFNTGTDDIYFVKGRDKDKGFLVSNREGAIAFKSKTCCYDIFQYEIMNYIYVYLEGVVYDQSLLVDSICKCKAGVNKAIVSLYLINEEEENTDENALFLKKITTGEDGAFTFPIEIDKSYKLVVTKLGYFGDHRFFDTKDIMETTTLKQQLKIGRIPAEPIVIKNIYYPFDESYLTESSMTILDTTVLPILIENSDIIVEIGSHTDNHGNDAYNEKLSQRRAQSVVDYLIQKGIAKNRLQAKGYGEHVHIAPNEHPDGSDNPEGRQKNRRTEFRVIGTLEGVSKIIYEE